MPSVYTRVTHARCLHPAPPASPGRSSCLAQPLYVLPVDLFITFRSCDLAYGTRLSPPTILPIYLPPLPTRPFYAHVYTSAPLTRFYNRTTAVYTYRLRIAAAPAAVTSARLLLARAFSPRTGRPLPARRAMTTATPAQHTLLHRCPPRQNRRDAVNCLPPTCLPAYITPPRATFTCLLSARRSLRYCSCLPPMNSISFL